MSKSKCRFIIWTGLCVWPWVSSGKNLYVFWEMVLLKGVELSRGLGVLFTRDGCDIHPQISAVKTDLWALVNWSPSVVTYSKRSLFTVRHHISLVVSPPQHGWWYCTRTIFWEQAGRGFIISLLSHKLFWEVRNALQFRRRDALFFLVV